MLVLPTVLDEPCDDFVELVLEAVEENEEPDTVLPLTDDDGLPDVEVKEILDMDTDDVGKDDGADG